MLTTQATALNAFCKVLEGNLITYHVIENRCVGGCSSMPLLCQVYRMMSYGIAGCTVHAEAGSQSAHQGMFEANCVEMTCPMALGHVVMHCMRPFLPRQKSQSAHLWMLEANCVEMTRPLPLCPSTRCMILFSTDASLTVLPGDNTFVESLMNNVAPSRPAPKDAVKQLSLHNAYTNLLDIPDLVIAATSRKPMTCSLSSHVLFQTLSCMHVTVDRSSGWSAQQRSWTKAYLSSQRRSCQTAGRPQGPPQSSS